MESCRVKILIRSGVIASLWLSGAVYAAGNCYVLRPIVIDDKVRPIEPVCRVLAMNLNRFCDQPPMVCGLKIHPDFKGQLTQPKWKPVPTDRERIEAFIRAPWKAPNTTEFEDKNWLEDGLKIKAALAENRLRFAEANVDIYNLGKKQPAYRLDLGDCEAIARSRGSGDPLDFDRTWIHHSPEVVKDLFSRYSPIGASHLNGDLFVYRGKTYNAGMWGNVLPATGMPENYLWVNRYERIRLLTRNVLDMNNICEFEYHPLMENAK